MFLPAQNAREDAFKPLYASPKVQLLGEKENGRIDSAKGANQL